MPWASLASSAKVSVGLLPLRAIARPSSTSISLSGTPSVARRERDDLLAHAVAGHHRRGAGIDRLAAREGADALRDRGGVAHGHHDVLDAAAELVGDDLRQRRARALALVGGAGRDRDLAVGAARAR